MPLERHAQQLQTQVSLLHRSLTESDKLPLRSLVSDERIASTFHEEEVDFEETDDAVYTPAITLCGLLSKVLFKEEQRGCLTAVVRIAVLWSTLGRKIDSTNTSGAKRVLLH